MVSVSDYFPGITEEQQHQFKLLSGLYREWNAKINVISRKDIDNFEIHHLLFSLSIAKFFNFKPGTRIMDAGTGGGLPGIPLAIMFPEVSFTLVDSIAKKIRVVEEISSELKLKNVLPLRARFEEIDEKFDFITGRAVTSLPVIYKMLKTKILPSGLNDFDNGIIYLGGGDLKQDLVKIPSLNKVYHVSQWIDDPFFATKQIVYLYNFR